MEQISKYRLYWAEIRAPRGIVRQVDRVKMALGRKSVIYRPMGGRGDCSEFIERMKAARLAKRYEVRFFTDAQFSRGVNNRTMYIYYAI